MILCLGKATYLNAMDALGKQMIINETYIAFKDKNVKNPEKVRLQSGRLTRIFALGHPGAIGVLNRNANSIDGKKCSNSEVEKMVEDWKCVRKYVM